MGDRTGVLSPAALWRRLGLAHHNWPGRFTFLLATILLLLVTQPMFVGHAFAQNIATATISLVLLAALYAFRATRIYFVIASVLLVPSIGCRLALLFTSNPTVEVVSAISSGLFLAVTVIALVSRLFIVRSVTLDTISAAICAYLLTGVTFAYAFAVVELQHPGSFSAALFQRPAGRVAPLIASLHSFVYYSFVCLTTTGFGDIAPISEGARSLSVMESVFGQLYVAILIARLVSLEVAQSMTQERE
ncbi:MAG TPA: potassium channel family protein [Candidatus Binatus sp.]|uniref:potassium channel family protein n=1 Tax=Candidatus Binatus sp. TaxID=2811406 RepID=UPI002B468951|nr:potassium channel family protein [Candidatus Binatus sp.]HKN13292.1 potassium channel family protein [Candidatus Binatus sp.]